MNRQLKTRQVCLFAVAFLPVTKFFLLPSVLASECGRDMWIACLLDVLADAAAVISVLILNSLTDKTFFELLEITFGKTIKNLLLFLYFIYFFVSALLPISEQRNYVDHTLYETPPSFITFLPFFIISAYLGLKQLRVLGRAADVMWIFTCSATVFLFFLSLQSADFFAIFPIGRQGAGKIVSAGMKGYGWFGDAVYLLFMVGRFDRKKNDGKKLFLSFILAEFFVLLFVFMFYCIFTSISWRQIFALTEFSKYATVINNVGRFDYIAILFILFVGVFSLSLPLYFAVTVLCEIFGENKRWIFSLAVNGGVMILSYLLDENLASLKQIVTGYGFWFFFVFGNILPILSVFLKKEKRKIEKSFN